MDDAGRFYKKESESASTHVGLRWKSRIRYTVPRDRSSQRACWEVFQPGSLELPMRAMARFPRLSGSVSCVEGPAIELIRELMGMKAERSCCRAGAAGVWSKDTILFLDKVHGAPLFLVKAGVGEGVNALLENEARWLQQLRQYPSLVGHIPALVAHRLGTDVCFVGQSALRGDLEFNLGDVHFEFLRSLQQVTVQLMLYEDSRSYQTLASRLADLDQQLSEPWSTRLNAAMGRVNHAFSGLQVPMVAAHRDFTPWNVRVDQGILKVFDWEFADDAQLPIFDPLHFALTPMALKGASTQKIIQRMMEALAQCRAQLQQGFCYQEKVQALAYLISVCTYYLSSVKGQYDSHPVLDSYALVIDQLCDG